MKLEILQEAVNIALKEGNTLKVDALRSVIAAAKKSAIDKRCNRPYYRTDRQNFTLYR